MLRIISIGISDYFHMMSIQHETHSTVRQTGVVNSRLDSVASVPDSVPDDTILSNCVTVLFAA